MVAEQILHEKYRTKTTRLEEFGLMFTLSKVTANETKDILITLEQYPILRKEFKDKLSREFEYRKCKNLPQ
jgi:hypothetical protein